MYMCIKFFNLTDVRNETIYRPDRTKRERRWEWGKGLVISFVKIDKFDKENYKPIYGDLEFDDEELKNKNLRRELTFSFLNRQKIRTTVVIRVMTDHVKIKG